MTDAFKGGPSSFADYGGKRVSIVLSLPTGERELFGLAEYDRDPLLGNVLRVSVDDAAVGDMELLVSEREWSGKISHHTGRDYDLRFDATGS